MKRIAVIQPGYAPWLGFFELMASSDIFVIYDDVQYDKNGWRNRNRIKTSQGIQWLTIPVLTTGKNFPNNNEIMVADHRWRNKHLNSLKQNYCKSTYFNEVFPMIEEGLRMDSDRLIDFDMFFIRQFASYLGIQTEIVFSSNLGITGEDKADRLINICKYFNATHYYNGAAGKAIYHKDYFLKRGIILEFQEYQHPHYRQLYGVFTPYLSTIDLLFNEGEASAEIILNGRKIS